jgi:hypothetical protein
MSLKSVLAQHGCATNTATDQSMRRRLQCRTQPRRLIGGGLFVAAVCALVSLYLIDTAGAAAADEQRLLKQKPVRVSEKTVLYEEDPAYRTGIQSTGAVAWCVEQLEARDASTSSLAIRGEMVLPGDKFKMTFSMRKGANPVLPEAQTIELTFSPSPGFSGKGIDSVPGILTKESETSRGKPLSAEAFKSAENVFRIDLSGANADRQSNAQLLHRGWFDIPMVFATKRRAILAMEIGSSGRSVPTRRL